MKKYSLSMANPNEMPPGSQTLMDESIVWDTVTDTTTLTFTKFLIEPGELSYDLEGPNSIFFATGDPAFADRNVLANHGNSNRGTAILDLTPCPTNPCPGGQGCQPPPCTTCSECITAADCGSIGCDWQQGGLPCEGGTKCSACNDEGQTFCENAGCSWNSVRAKCTGGDQTGASSQCNEGTGGPNPVHVCPLNPAVCGDST